MNILFAYQNDADAATLTQSSEHLSFPAVNVQQRWFVKPWRSKYGALSSWGMFRVDATHCKIYFDEGGGTLTATLTNGDYDADSICAEIKTRMDAAGALVYTVSYSDITNKFTIAGSGAFVLVLSSTASSFFPALGWIAVVNTASLASHTAPLIRINTEEALRFNLGATKQMDFVAIKNHNLQSTATIELRYYSDAYITWQATEVLTWSADIIAAIIDQSYPYVLLAIADVDNPDLYVEIGRFWTGASFTPRIGFSMERSLVPEDPSVISESENGQEASIQRTHFNIWNYTFEGVDPGVGISNDDKADFDAMFATVGKSKPVFICEKPDESDITPYTKYVRLTGWEWEHIAGEWWKLSLEVKEER